MARKYESLFQRIMSKVVTLDWQNENGCWIFTGKLDKDGYGRVNVRIAGRHLTIRVHKIIWESFNGPMPSGMTLDHMEHCIGKACCNPDHLEAVTRSVNTSRSQKRNPRGGFHERRTSIVAGSQHPHHCRMRADCRVEYRQVPGVLALCDTGSQVGALACTHVEDTEKEKAMRMEVRCCCQPKKLLGTVEVPNGTKANDLLVFPLMTMMDVHWGAPYESPEVGVSLDTLRLQCKTFVPQGRSGYPAVKAEGVSLDTLRRIPSFEEAEWTPL